MFAVTFDGSPKAFAVAKTKTAEELALMLRSLGQQLSHWPVCFKASTDHLVRPDRFSGLF
jgi:D-tyrosyl-tRNA(Tyr) deacylase